MPFLENLVEGLSEAAGNEGAVSRIEKNKADRKATADEELHGNTRAILDDVYRLQERRAALPAGSPEIAEIDKSLAEHQRAFTDLYHPTKNPGALSKLGGFLKQHIAGKTPAPAQPSNAMTPDRMAGLRASAAGTQSADPYLTPDDLKKKARIAAGLDPRATAEKPEKFQSQLTETTDADGKKHYWRVPLEPGANPEEVDFRGQAVSPKAGRDKYAWTKKDGKFVSVKLDANGQIIPGSENPNILPPASLTGRISTGQYHYVDDKGQIHEVQETRSSMPAGQGAPSVPKTPGEAKNKAAAVAPKDKVIGFKGSKDYIDTKTSYEAAIDRTKTMDQNLKNALNGDQQAMLSLVANHIGMTLGAQKGARITRAVWDEAVQSAPWLARVASRFDERGYLSGVTLAPEQMQQMVRLAHEKTQTLKEHLGRLDKERGADNGNTQPSGKAVSLAAAKKLPAMQGKTDDEIRAAIKAAGHEVAP